VSSPARDQNSLPVRAARRARRAAEAPPAAPPAEAPVDAPAAPRALAVVQRQTVASMTVSLLRERILRSEYPEGEPLRQDAIALAFGVSRIPVREALRQLEAEGLVSFHPHRGAVVSSLSLPEINEVFSLRAALECDLLRRAIPRVTDEHLESAGEVLDGYGQAFREGDVAAWGEFNRRFHAALYAAADRPITAGIVQRLHQQSDRYSRIQLVLTHGQSRAAEEHQAILDAVRERDVRGATTLMKRHILGAGRTLLDCLHTERGAAAPASTWVRS
jgi:DNA-binding GntR family transcriptional regulator